MKKGIFAFLLMLLSTGLIYSGTIKIITVPEADIYVDGALKGRGSITFKSKKEVLYSVKLSGVEGYFDAQTRVSNESVLGDKSVTIELKKDNSFFETKKSTDSINKNIILDINPKYDLKDAWLKLVSSITAVHSDFEILDQSSMFLKTTWKIAGQGSDELRIRSRILIALNTMNGDQKSFRFKIESQKINAKNEVVEQTVDRTFDDFLNILDTLQNLLKN